MRKTQGNESGATVVPMLDPEVVVRIRLLGAAGMGHQADRISTFLDQLLAEETEAKQQKRVAMGIQIAHLPAIKTLEEFDFKFQPSLDAKLVRELATGRFIAGAENVLLFGPPGVGKTHLAIALGRAAVEAGHSALFVTATSLLAALSRAQQEGKLADRSPSTPNPSCSSSTSSATCPWRSRPRPCSSSWSAGATSAAACSSPPTRPSRRGARLRRRDDHLGRARPRAPPQSRPAHPGRQLSFDH